MAGGAKKSKSTKSTKAKKSPTKPEQAPDENAVASVEPMVVEPAAESPVVEAPDTPPAVPAEATVEALPQNEGSVALPAEKPPKKMKPVWFFPATIAGVILLLGAGAYGYFGYYLQRPENVWKAALTNTQRGLSALTDKGITDKKGAVIDGTAKIKTPLTVDATLKGTVYEQNASVDFQATAVGYDVAAAIRTAAVKDAASPDVYVKLTGIKAFAPLLGNQTLTALTTAYDGQWLKADHTFMNQLLLESGLTSDLSNSFLTDTKARKDIQSVGQRAVTVINDRLLSADPKKAVFKVAESMGKEDIKGRTSYHYKVTVQKAQLREFVTALKDELKQTKLQQWLLGDTPTQSFEAASGYDALLKQIDAANFDAQNAEVWVDSGYKTIRNVRLFDSPTDKKSYTDLLFDFKGTDEFPLVLSVVADNASGTQNISFGVTLNQANESILLSLDGSTANTKGQKTVDASLGLKITPSDERVSVEVPSKTIDVTQLLSAMLGQALPQQLQVRKSSGLQN